MVKDSAILNCLMRNKILFCGATMPFINQKEDRALLTDSAMFIYITEDDSAFVHADTLRTMPDSAGNRQLKAYHSVRLFKSNLQGICDSLFYTTSDSILKLYDKPVLWSGGNQLSAEYIEIWTKEQANRPIAYATACLHH